MLEEKNKPNQEGKKPQKGGIILFRSIELNV